jgi:hypothetical protein
MDCAGVQGQRTPLALTLHSYRAFAAGRRADWSGGPLIFAFVRG